MLKLSGQAPDLPTFYEQLAAAPRRVLMSDYDGTLSALQKDRNTAGPYVGVVEVLSKIIAGGRTRLVLVSGRAAHQLGGLLNMDPLPEIWGSHGWERLLSKDNYIPPNFSAEVDRSLLYAKSITKTWAQAAGLAEQVEIKPASVALHWRDLSKQQMERIQTWAYENWIPLQAPDILTLKEFDGGYELFVPGRSKADAVRSILADESSDVVSAFLGDDKTDEDAFHALAGRGLRILVRSERRETAADIWLTPPAELLAFLEQWV